MQSKALLSLLLLALVCSQSLAKRNWFNDDEENDQVDNPKNCLDHPIAGFTSKFSFDNSEFGASVPITVSGSHSGIPINVDFIIVDAETVEIEVVTYGSSPENAAQIVADVTGDTDGLSLHFDWVVMSAAASVRPAAAAAALLASVAGLTLLSSHRALSSPVFLLCAIALVGGGSVLINASFEPDNCSSVQVTMWLPRALTFVSSPTFQLRGGSASCAKTTLYNTVCAKLEWTPVGEASKLGPYDYAKMYTVKEIQPGSDPNNKLYLVTDSSGVYNSMFLVTSTGVIVVDSPPTVGTYNQYDPATPTQAMAPIRNITNKPVVYFVYSHMHIDHVGAANLIDAQHRVAHERCQDALIDAADPTRPVADVIFSGSDPFTLTVGSGSLTLQWIGDFHSQGDIAIYSAPHKTMMVVDLVWPNWGPFESLGYTISVPRYFLAHNWLLTNTDWEVLVPGHMMLGDHSHVQDSLDFANFVRGHAFTAVYGTSFTPYNAMLSETGNPWGAFGSYFAEVIAKCVDLVKADNQWKIRFNPLMAGSDRFLRMSCYQLINEIRLDKNN